MNAAIPSPRRSGLNVFGVPWPCAAVAAAVAADVAADAEAMEAGTLHAAPAEQTAARDCCVPRMLSETSGSTPETGACVGAA
jgi:hypothetical protein